MKPMLLQSENISFSRFSIIHQENVLLFLVWHQNPALFHLPLGCPQKVMVGKVSAGSGNQACDVFLHGQPATSITMGGLDLMHPRMSSALRHP